MDWWVHQLITNKFITTYNHRFFSDHSILKTLPELGLIKLVTDTDNEELINGPTLEAVKAVLFSIDSCKTPGPDGFGAVFLKTIGTSLKRIFWMESLNSSWMARCWRKSTIPSSLFSQKFAIPHRPVTLSLLDFAQRSIKLLLKLWSIDYDLSWINSFFLFKAQSFQEDQSVITFCLLMRSCASLRI